MSAEDRGTTECPSPRLSTTHHVHRFPTMPNRKASRMSTTIRTALVTGATALGIVAASVVGVAFASADSTVTEPTPATIDYSTVELNGLAEEQEAAAAQAERDRVAAEAAAVEAARIEADRVAAEAALAAAQAEADRVAAEAESFAVVADEPAEPADPAPVVSGPDPGTQSHTICEVLADGTAVPCIVP